MGESIRSPGADTGSASSKVAALFPGALGDFLCWLPTLYEIRKRHRGQLLLCARPALLDLVELKSCVKASIDRREIANLFAATTDLATEALALFEGVETTHSWTGFGDPVFASRLGRATGGLVCIHPFHDLQPGEHAVDYYARCIGAQVGSLPRNVIVTDGEWLGCFLERHRLGASPWLLVHPGSGSARKNWQGFEQLVTHWRTKHHATVVALFGPAEEKCHVTADIAVRDISLRQAAALLGACTAYAGNDSGISHLAGWMGSRGVVLFGPSDPRAWAPRSANLRIIYAAEPCPKCGPDAFCLHRLPVADVAGELAFAVEG